MHPDPIDFSDYPQFIDLDDGYTYYIDYSTYSKNPYGSNTKQITLDIGGFVQVRKVGRDISPEEQEVLLEKVFQGWPFNQNTTDPTIEKLDELIKRTFEFSKGETARWDYELRIALGAQNTILQQHPKPVSYTHLTLPTIYSV